MPGDNKKVTPDMKGLKRTGSLIASHIDDHSLTRFPINNCRTAAQCCVSCNMKRNTGLKWDICTIISLLKHSVFSQPTSENIFRGKILLKIL